MFDGLMLHPEYLIPIAAIVCGCVVALVAILSGMWRGVRRAEVEATLKQDMLNRGMSVDQIERVIRASAYNEEKSAPPEPITDNEYYLVEKLVEEGKTSEDIERIIKAFKTSGGAMPRKEHCSSDITT